MICIQSLLEQMTSKSLPASFRLGKVWGGHPCVLWCAFQEEFSLGDLEFHDDVVSHCFGGRGGPSPPHHQPWSYSSADFSTERLTAHTWLLLHLRTRVLQGGITLGSSFLGFTSSYSTKHLLKEKMRDIIYLVVKLVKS